MSQSTSDRSQVPHVELYVEMAGRRHKVELEADAVRVDGEPVGVELRPPSTGLVRVARIGHRTLRVVARREAPGRWSLEIEGRRHRVRVMNASQRALEEAARRERDSGGPEPLRAPMPGLVVGIEVSPGDVVEHGSTLVIVEAMKMENELRARGPARVAHVRVKEGTTVEKGQLLMEFEDVEVET